ncbi:KAP family P-loop NTPase fold protein [Micromonospora aurantiaca (nom. illeg.)]|uniref:KAP family P-loop NTPase fold protein n=1 Tax=Micromonospora aurantiaca (nom. illeg.) TaxID=47850 RepID=UPI003F4A774F
MIGDDPVKSDGDLLQRRPIAEQWAGAIAAADSPSGLVFAVTGPWGSGKTSMLNMVEEFLVEKGVRVLHFNPWFFSGTDQLVTFFFSEVADQISNKDGKQSKVAESLRKYGTLLSPVKAIPLVGTALGGAAEAATSIGTYMEQSLSRSVNQRRKEIEDGFSKLDRPFVVVIDDIDRLTGQEIRDVLRMVRLTGAFPNMIYLLSFDRHRVELALKDDGIPGRAYLEKIVQVMFDVPGVSKASLRQILTAELNSLMKTQPEDIRFNVGIWPDIYYEIIDPLLTNIRDVRRFTASLPAVVALLRNDIELADVIALEAIRIFLPDTFALLPHVIDGLTSTSDYRNGQEENKRQVMEFLGSDPDHEALLKRACGRLFPAAARHIGGSNFDGSWSRQWLRERRVASAEILTYYLEKAIPEVVAHANAAERAFTIIEDEEALSGLLSSLEPRETEGVISLLEAHEEDFANLNPAPGVTALLNQIQRLDRPETGMFDFGPRIVVIRVVLRLLRSVADLARTADLVRSILPNIQTFAAQYELLLLVGYTPNAGQRLIPEEEWQALVRDVKSRVREAGPDELATETGMMKLLRWASSGDDVEVWTLPTTYLDNRVFATALLQDSYSPVHSQTMGSRHVATKDRLAWEALGELVGGEEGIRRCRDAAEVELGQESPLIALVDKYLAGWRPADI